MNLLKYCVISTSDNGPDIHEFTTRRERLLWLAKKDDSMENFYSFEVNGEIDGLTTANVGQYANEELIEIEGGSKALELGELQWLVLPEEETFNYTYFANGCEGDVSELVERINRSKELNFGYDDWRVPEIEELKTLIGSNNAPASGWFWSSTKRGDHQNEYWVVDFTHPGPGYHVAAAAGQLRLVRSGACP